MFRFGTTQSWSAYGTTRNTSVTFKVTLNDNTGSGGTKFASSGSIKITVTKGGDNFKELGSSGTVEITLNSGGSIKKYDKEKTITQDNLKEIGGTGETLAQDTKLEIQATGRITTPEINGSEVTIKADITVSSTGNLTSALTLRPDLVNDPSSDGLSGTITPQTTGASAVSISTGTINLTLKSLEALKSHTKNAVTLTGTGGSNFRSSASITITRTSGNVDFTKLPVSGKLEIAISGGSIKKLDENGQPEELKTTTNLKVGTKLSLDATGTITEPETGNATVNLTGTIVVTNKDPQSLGTNGLTFGGGPSASGVSGSLNLSDSADKKYVNITSGSSSLEIKQAAYNIIKKAYDTTSSFFTIGAADPRNPTQARDAGGLANEQCFQKYWHLLPSNWYDPNDLPYLTVISSD